MSCRSWCSLALIVVVAAATSTACAGASDAGTKASSPPPTRRVLPVDFSQPGPYRVGVTELNITPQASGEPGTTGPLTAATEATTTTGSAPGEVPALQATATRRAVVFYPAVADALGQYPKFEGYSTADAFPEELRPTIPPELVQMVKLEAFKDAPANKEGPFPVVIHSHGAGSFYLFESRHYEQLASWGFVVAAPDHRERSLAAQLIPPSPDSSPGIGEQDVTDLRNTLQALRAQNLVPNGTLQGALNLDQVAAEGHAEGGRAAALFAADSAVKTFIGEAPVPPLRYEDQAASQPAGLPAALVNEKLTDLKPPPKSSMLIASDRDGVIPLASVQAEFEWLAPPKTLAVLKNAGHNAYSDLCAPIRARGGLSQYSSRLPALAALFKITEDGCLPDNLDPDRGYALISQLAIAQLRWVFQIDESRESLDPTFLQKTFPDAYESITFVG